LGYVRPGEPSRRAIIGGFYGRVRLFVQESVTESTKARVDDERRPDQKLLEFLHALLASLLGLFVLVLVLALRRGDLAEGAPSLPLTAPSEGDRDDLLRIQERLLARGLADRRCAFDEPFEHDVRLGLELLARMRRCSLEETLRRLCVEGAISSHGQMSSPDHCRLRRIGRTEASQPRVDFGPAWVPVERLRRPCLDPCARH